MLSLYRRHRPRTFSAVVGQEHIVKTLRNAIELGKVHHAYLFVGSRGTGKTSVAKLLACALNAEGGPTADFDPDAPAAKAIMGGTSLDVVEMDAASNNSVDDIRELRENVALAPMGGSRRVYILDEAHMLTPQAWNAFLKTLEEPPPHVVFVLATTEAHKVPPTIIDRCHQFRFHRPSLNQVADVVKKVAAEEEIQVPDAAVGMIARSATGSFRDALGTLEQMVTYGGRELELDDVLEVLGVADAAVVLDTTEALADHDPKAALLAVRRLAESGLDFTQFMRELTAHLRQLYEVQVLGEVPESFSVTAEHTERLTAQAERLNQAELLRTIDLLAAALASVKEGSEPLIQLEVALLKATQPQADASLQALMFRIEQLEGRVANAPASGESKGDRGEAPPPPASSPPNDAPVARAAGGGGPVAAAAVAEDPDEEPQALAISYERICELWPALCEAVRESNAMVAAVLKEGRPSALEGEKLTVTFAEGAAFMRKKAEANADLLRGAVRGLTGQSLALGFELGGGPVGAPSVMSEEELIERLKANMAAEEVFEDEQEQS
jgi:DNA polymerase-3 subunit gamma/tau